MKTSPYGLLSRSRAVNTYFLVKELKIHFQNIHVNMDNDRIYTRVFDVIKFCI